MNNTKKQIGEIIKVYDNWFVKAYSWGRFKILHQRFLDEIGQYLPKTGRVLDIGCGFGLFSCYYASKYPNLEFFGIDINPERIRMASRAADRLCLANVHFEVAEVTAYQFSGIFNCAYMLDIVHHVPRRTVSGLMRKLNAALGQNSRLIIKDVDVKPAYKRLFTYVLDKAMDLQAPVNYWSSDDLMRLLNGEQFEVFLHSMVDILPYPHVLYICNKKAPSG
jgi:2-polyprenyl-3-methyl-5-hydroxy-6-metoxy-1,4-benzoquinol methylase